MRALREKGKQQMTSEEMDRMNIDLMGLSETFLPAEAQYRLRPTKRNNRTYKILTSSSDSKGRKGVGIMFDEKMEPLIENVVIKGCSEMGISLKGEKVKTMIIQVYMPDINATTKKEVLLTYQEVEKTENELCHRKRDRIIIMCDFNARIGKDRVDRVTATFLWTKPTGTEGP